MVPLTPPPDTVGDGQTFVAARHGGGSRRPRRDDRARRRARRRRLAAGQLHRRPVRREKAFARLGVRGEISNLRAQPNGNCYFDLKDRDALLNCVAFSEAAASFPALANGDEVVAYGSVQTYAKASRYQLRVFEVEPVGSSGALHRRYEALKARLAPKGCSPTSASARCRAFRSASR